MKVVLRCILAILILALALPAIAADAWHPKITPVSKVDFNWAPPRQIGEPDFFAIARDGKAACSIVIPDKPSKYEEKGAGLLKLYLDMVTGGSFQIKHESESSGPAIYIGMTEVGKRNWTDLPKIKYSTMTLPNLHGFGIKTVDKDTLIIRGQFDLGTAYAVPSFLREYAGVQRYWPSEPGGIGDVYTRKATLTIPRLTWLDWPYLISRHTGFNAKGWETTVPEGTWPWMFFWYRMGTSLSMMHNFFELIPPEQYAKTHPEYFPEINGVRQIPTKQINWQPCVSNPEVVQICADQIIKAFDRDPNRICHALAVNDGAGDCMCAKCRAMDSPDADTNTRVLTDRYVKFMNAVAEKVAAKYPDRLIGFLSYSSLTYPPTTVKLHPNLVPFYCAMGRGVYVGWDQWMAAGAQNMGHYGYHDDRWFTLPKINPHQEAARMRYTVGSGTQRGMYKEFNPTYPLDGQAAIVVASMMWDPRLDENKILADYYNGMFGESAKEMQAFYDTLEKDYEAWLKATAQPHPSGYDRTDLDLDHSYEQFQVLTARGAENALQHLMKAKGMARDPKVQERIGLTEAIYRFVYYCDKEYWLIKSLPNCKTAADAEKQARQVLWYARAKADYKEKVMQKPPVQPWWMVYREPYDQIKVGTIPEEVYQAIDRGFRSAYRPQDKAFWEKLAKDSDPVIAKSAQAISAFAHSMMPELVEDGGFEQGMKLEVTNDDPIEGKAVITREKPHTGQECAMIYDCKASYLVKRVAVKPGEKLWISAWVRTLEYPGRFNIIGLYGIRINAKGKDKVVNWVREKIEPANEWQQFTMPYTVPAGADTLEVTVNVMRQHAKARAWVDDISVVRAPVEPMDMSASGPAASEAGPPE